MDSVLILCRAICWTVVLFVLFGLMVVIANHYIPCNDSEEDKAKDESEKEEE